MVIASEAEGRIETLKRIEGCRRMRSQELDLSGLMLTEVPKELYTSDRAFDWLKHLYLGLAQEAHDRPRRNSLAAVPGALFDALPLLELLDLAGNNLGCLPREICRLTRLISLNLCNNGIGGEGAALLAGLTTLTSLNLRNNDIGPEGCRHLIGLKRLTELDLGGNAIGNEGVAYLTGLTTLTSLNLAVNEINDPEDVAHIAGLTALTSLDLTFNVIGPEGAAHLAGLTGLVELELEGSAIHNEGVAHLTGLAKLSRLGISYNDIGPEGVAHLTGLTRLTSLDLSRNRIGDLSPLLRLPNLERINLSWCEIDGVYSEFWAKPSLQHVFFAPGKLFSVPSVLLSRNAYTDDCLPRLRAYFAGLEAGKVGLTDVKVMLLGNGRVGKTKIARRLLGEHYGGDDEPSTHGVQVKQTILPMPTGPEARLRIWDFGGQDIYHGTHALFMKSRAIFSVVWTPAGEAARRHEHGGFTFYNEPLGYWLAYVRQMGGERSPVIVIQAQADAPEDEQAPPIAQDALAAFERGPEIVAYSARTDRRRGRLNSALIDAVATLRHCDGEMVIPKGWAWVKTKIEIIIDREQRLPVTERHHQIATLDEFDEVCELARSHPDGGPVDNAVLLQYLHDTGTVFWRKGLFDDSIILDQQWALDGVYAVFDRAKGAYNNILDNGGRFRRSQLASWVWRSYSPPTQALFITFMKQCGICFEWRDGGQQSQLEDEYVAPDLLPETKAKSVEVMLTKWGTRADGQGARRYPFLPQGLMRTLMAEVGAKAGIYADYWRDGFMFYDAETRSNAKVWQAWDTTADGEAMWSGAIRVTTRDGDAKTLLARLLWVIDATSVRFGAKAERMDGSSVDCDARAAFSRELALRRSDIPEADGDGRGDNAVAVLRPALAPAMQPEWCVSYAWGDDTSEESRRREALVERFCAEATARGREIVRDITHMRTLDSILEFVRRIGRAERVYVFLSEQYLQRWYCMLELMEVWKKCGGERAAFNAKTRVYVMPGVGIADELQRVKYAEFWDKRFQEYGDLIRRPGPRLVSEAGYFEYCRIEEFVGNISRILAEVQDRLAPRDFDAFVQYGLDDHD